MTLAPILNASSAVQLHLLAATAALFSGAAVLLLKKGTQRHRLLGTIAASGMFAAAVTSYWIRHSGGFSWIHLLSILTVFSVVVGLWRRRQGDVENHRRWMIGAYAGLVAAGVFTLIPGRAMYAVVFGG